MESSVQEGCGAVRAHPEKDHKNAPGLEHLSYEDRLRAGAVQHGEEKAAGRPQCGLSVIQGRL